MNKAEIRERLNFALEQFEAHKSTAFHEQPPCGGCHWWQGYAGALADLISGERPKPIVTKSPNIVLGQQTSDSNKGK